MKKEESLRSELKDLSSSDIYPFHMPGHKRNMKGSLLSGAYDIDITEIDGFDDLSCPGGLIGDIEKRAAGHYGADRAFLLVNGSTCGVLSSISAAVPHRGRLVCVRNSHKSAFNAAYLGEIETFYVKPRMYDKYGIFGDLDTDSLDETLRSIRRPDAVFITSPTYEGFISDVEKAAKIAHERDIPLIVDGAHGAHLKVSRQADVTIVSLHKTYPALTSSALCLVNGNRVDPERLKFFINIFQTSSPSYVLMAGMDECLALVEREGSDREKALKKELAGVYDLCRQTGSVRLITGEEVRRAGGAGFDGTKLNFYDESGRLSGRRIYDILLKKYHIQPEMAYGRFCLCICSVMDTPEGFFRLKEAVRGIDDDLRSNKLG